MPGPVKTRGAVLTRLDYGNTSRIITFLTPDRGLVTALAKGARRPKGVAGLGGGLDLLSEAEILYYERRAGMAVLAEWSETWTPSAALGRSAVRLGAAEVCAEFARWCATEGEPQPEVCRLLSEGARQACEARRLVPPALAAALGMLSAAGFRPEVEACAVCGGALGPAGRAGRAFLSAEEGGLLCPRCAARSGGRPGGGNPLSPEAGALLAALARRRPAAAARLRPSRAAEGELVPAVEAYASWRLERRMRSLSGLARIIAALEAAGCGR